MKPRMKSSRRPVPARQPQAMASGLSLMSARLEQKSQVQGKLGLAAKHERVLKSNKLLQKNQSVPDVEKAVVGADFLAQPSIYGAAKPVVKDTNTNPSNYQNEQFALHEHPKKPNAVGSIIGEPEEESEIAYPAEDGLADMKMAALSSTRERL